MRSIRKTDTKPEVRVRAALHRLGYRFRIHRRDLPGVPDIVLARHRTVVLVHGCFWHRHDCKLGRKQPRSNQDYWLPKLQRNRERDVSNTAALREVGWSVVVVWECETATEDGLSALLSARLAPLIASCDRLGSVPCQSGMGITIDRRAAEEVFQRALRLARSDAALPEEWIERTDRVAGSGNKTFTPALGTALLAKATDRHIDAFSLREDGGHKSYSARSVAKDVLVPCCKVADIDIRTTGAEPLNNQPFLRASRIGVDMNVRRGTEADLAYLCECLERADFLENEAALAALAAFLRARIRATGELEEVGIDGRPLAMVRLVESVSAFVDANSEGGKVGQAIVAAILDLVHKEVRTRKINDPSRGWTGDVGAFVEGRISLSVEVKQRPFMESEVLQFIERLGSEHVERGLVAALAQGDVSLDADRVAEGAMRYGIALDVVLGVRRLLLDAIRHIPGDPHEAMGLLPKLGLQRLKEIEASEDVQRAWVEATTE